MVRLQLFGTVRLLDADGRDIRAVIQQPKRLAVLAYLAIARPRGAQRRDRLVGLFWPESDESSARRSLSQTLYFLRQKIAANLFAGRFGEEVGLREDGLWCDVVAFEQALDEGRTAEALALYGGELLPGFHVSDAPEWEKWLDAERERLRDRAAEAAWSLAGAEESAGHAGAAAHWARWAAALAPYDEKQHRRMLELLVRAGDRAGALRAHEDFSRRLATEFEIEPSPETAALIAAIRQDVGGTAAAELVERAARGLERGRALQHGDAVEASTPPVVAAGRAQKGLRRRPGTRGVIAAALGLALLAAILVSVWNDSEASSALSTPPGQPLDRIAILPFRDLSPDGQLAYFADGLASTLTERLSSLERLSVISTSSTRQLAGVPIDSLGRALNVGSAVNASIARSAGKVRVIVELIDARSGVTLSSQTMEHADGDLFALFDELASTVAWMLRTELGQEIQLRDWRRETESVEAWDLVQRAREARTELPADYAAAERQIESALEHTGRAAALDPDYARVWIERSRAFETLAMHLVSTDAVRAGTMLDSAVLAAEQSIALDNESADGYEQRAHVTFLRWVFAPAADGAKLLGAAEADARAALARDANRPRAESLLSQILYQRGEFRQAYHAASRAYRADAYAARAQDILWRLFETAFEIGNDDEAGLWCDEIRRRLPSSWLHHRCTLQLLAFGSAGEPDIRKALLAYQAARAAEAQEPAQLARLDILLAANYARSGMSDSARAIVARIDPRTHPDLTVLLIAAGVHVQLDDHTAAIELLERYLTKAPGHRDRVLRSRLFEPVEEVARSRIRLTGRR